MTRMRDAIERAKKAMLSTDLKLQLGSIGRRLRRWLDKLSTATEPS